MSQVNITLFLGKVLCTFSWVFFLQMSYNMLFWILSNSTKIFFWGETKKIQISILTLVIRANWKKKYWLQLQLRLYNQLIPCWLEKTNLSTKKKRENHSYCRDVIQPVKNLELCFKRHIVMETTIYGVKEHSYFSLDSVVGCLERYNNNKWTDCSKLITDFSSSFHVTCIVIYKQNIYTVFKKRIMINFFKLFIYI